MQQCRMTSRPRRNVFIGSRHWLAQACSWHMTASRFLGYSPMGSTLVLLRLTGIGPDLDAQRPV
eukprot:7256672-Pyramimonas_sp.AAC.1